MVDGDDVQRDDTRCGAVVSYFANQYYLQDTGACTWLKCSFGGGLANFVCDSCGGVSIACTIAGFFVDPGAAGNALVETETARHERVSMEKVLSTIWLIGRIVLFCSVFFRSQGAQRIASIHPGGWIPVWKQRPHFRGPGFAPVLSGVTLVFVVGAIEMLLWVSR